MDDNKYSIISCTDQHYPPLIPFRSRRTPLILHKWVGALASSYILIIPSLIDILYSFISSLPTYLVNSPMYTTRRINVSPIVYFPFHGERELPVLLLLHIFIMCTPSIDLSVKWLGISNAGLDPAYGCP
jgi:hypothetical protein